MSTARDPCLDPRPGDRLRVPAADGFAEMLVYVTWRGERNGVPWVRWRLRCGSPEWHAHGGPLTFWQQSAAGAEIDTSGAANV